MNNKIVSSLQKSEICKKEMDKVVPRYFYGFLGSLVFRPLSTKVFNQNKNEEIYILIRSHWIVNIGWVANAIFYSILPVILYLFIPFFVSLLQIDFRFSDIPMRFWFISILVYYSFIFTYVFMHFIDWYYDIFIVTNERIIDLEFSPLLGYKIVEANLINIQDIKEESREFWGLIFNFGNIKAKTSSDQGFLMLNRVPNVYRVRDVISNLVNIAKKFN